MEGELLNSTRILAKFERRPETNCVQQADLREAISIRLIRLAWNGRGHT
jgi:hypothetical protein